MVKDASVTLKLNPKAVVAWVSRHKTIKRNKFNRPFLFIREIRNGTANVDGRLVVLIRDYKHLNKNILLVYSYVYMNR